MLQCAAVCCSVLQCVANVAVCCSVLQCVAVCYSVSCTIRVTFSGISFIRMLPLSIRNTYQLVASRHMKEPYLVYNPIVTFSGNFFEVVSQIHIN